MTFQTRMLRRDDWDEVARLIYESLNVWYEKNRGFRLVQGSWETMRIFPRVYESLDPGCCVVVEETGSRRIAGSCFYHPRTTHIALGILNTLPDFFGQGIASMLLRYVIDVAEKEGKPIRLVSGATNVDSFSLYSKAGFVPTCFFQDMTLKVPEEGIPIDPPRGMTVREALESDIPEMVALEKELVGIEREQDYRFFMKNEGEIWHVGVLLDAEGKIDGFLASVRDPGSQMLGPGVVRTEAGAAALVRAELNRFRGRNPVWLIPSQRKELVAAMYALGAKNCELHISQIRGEVSAPSPGIVFPTFMPETG